MTDNLTRSYQRWLDAEATGNDEAADLAFAETYAEAISAPVPSRAFAARTMAAIATAAEADARHAARVRSVVRWVCLPAAAVLLYIGAVPLASLLSSALVGTLNLLVSLVVMFADGSGARATTWAVLAGIGRAAAAFVDDPRVTLAMLACQAVAVAALVALHRLLGSGREWLR